MDSDEHFSVVVRCRPSRTTSSSPCLQIDDQSPTVTLQQSDGKEGEAFTFNAVFNPATDEATFYKEAVRPIVEKFLQGYNGTVIAFGPSECGKTRTITGCSKAGDGPPEKGAVQRAAEQVLNCIRKSRSRSRVAANLVTLVSFVFIHGDRVFDLLNAENAASCAEEGLEIVDGELVGVSQHLVRNAREVEALVAEGHRNHRQRRRELGHAIFFLTVEHAGMSNSFAPVSGTLAFADLAPSELLMDVSSPSSSSSSSPPPPTEGSSKADSSLKAFVEVVHRLAGKHCWSTPFSRDTSPLTSILRESLGGNCNTLFVCNIESDGDKCDDMSHALRIAHAATRIKNTANKRDLAEQALMSAYMKELHQRYKVVVVRTRDSEQLHQGEDNAEKVEVQDEGKDSNPASSGSGKESLATQAASALAEAASTSYEDEEILNEEEHVLSENEGRQSDPTHDCEIPAEEASTVKHESLAEGTDSLSLLLDAFESVEKSEENDKASESRRSTGDSMELDVKNSLQDKSEIANVDSGSSNEICSSSLQHHNEEERIQPESNNQNEKLATHADPSNQQVDECIEKRKTTKAAGKIELALLSEMSDDQLEPLVEMMRELGHGVPRIFQGVKKESNITRAKDDDVVLCSGSSLVSWVLARVEAIESPQAAQGLCEKLLERGVISHSEGSCVFAGAASLFYYIHPPKTTTNLTPSPTTTDLKDDDEIANSDSHSTVSLNKEVAEEPADALPDDKAAEQKNDTLEEEYVSEDDDDDDDDDDDVVIGQDSSVARKDQWTAFSEECEYDHPLHLAAAKGERSGVLENMILLCGVDLRDREGRTPCMYSIIANQLKCLQVFLACSTDVHAVDESGNTPLLLAVYKGNWKAASLLLKSGAMAGLPDEEGRTAIHWATRLESTKCLETLLRFAKKEDVNRQDFTHLTALHWAVAADKVEMVQLLLRNNADPCAVDSEGRTVVNYCILKGATNSLKAFLCHQPNLMYWRDENGHTPLHIASTQESLCSLEVLLTEAATRKMKENCTDLDMASPLHWAAMTNKPQAVQRLLLHGVDRDAKDSRGLTAFDYTTEEDYKECQELLSNWTNQSHLKGKRTSVACAVL